MIPDLAVTDLPRAPVNGFRGFVATLHDAVRGSSLDYTTGPTGRAIFMLAVPMVLEMLMESVFAVADVFWVARR